MAKSEKDKGEKVIELMDFFSLVFPFTPQHFRRGIKERKKRNKKNSRTVVEDGDNNKIVTPGKFHYKK